MFKKWWDKNMKITTFTTQKFGWYLTEYSNWFFFEGMKWFYYKIIANFLVGLFFVITILTYGILFILFAPFAVAICLNEYAKKVDVAIKN